MDPNEMMSSWWRRHSSCLEQISSNNPSSWFSSEDKAEASFTGGTAVLDMMSRLELWGFSCFVCLFVLSCEYEL